MAEQTAQVTVTGTPENPVFNFVLPSGARGEPGGWNVGTNLGVGDAARNLNDVTSPGLYHQGDLGTAQKRELNYPPQKDVGGSVRGVLSVKSWSGGTSIIQEYINIGNRGDATPRPLMVYRRHNNGTEWSQWFAYPAMSIITDINGGKSVNIWEDTTNSWLPITGPGGQSDPVILDSQVSINTITTSGSYSHGVGVTTAQNYPVSGVAGFLRVRRVNGNINLIEQEWTPFAHTQVATNWSRGYYVRMMNSGTWSPWRFISSQRVDQTAGRAIYTWDDLNNREQMIYGDTGWRNITSLFPTWTSGFLLYRRTLNVVELLFEAVAFSDPVGTSYTFELPGTSALLTGNIEIPATLTSAPPYLLEYSWSGQHKLTKTSVHGVKGYASFPTRSPWPTTLAGTPHT